MSRRRREQKERKRELAHQMGVKDAEQLDTLREKLRVTRLVLRAVEAEIVDARFALRPESLVVGVGVILIEPQGARWLASVDATAEGKVKKGATLPLAHAAVDDDRVRYARPATLVLVAATAGAGALTDVPIDQIKVGGHALTSADAKRLEGLTAFQAGDRAGSARVFAVPHRLKEEAVLEVADGSRRCAVTVELTF